jgi:hypothetical protein
MSAAAFSVGASNTSNGTLTQLPYHQRHWAIQYTNDNGSVGCTAYPINFDEVYNLKGRLLTLIDASTADPEQRKAQKDLVWQTLRSWMEGIERAGTWQAEPVMGESVTSIDQP